MGRRPVPRHVPVLLDRVVALLAPALARRARSASTRRSASAATPRRVLRQLTRGPGRRRRPRPAGARARGRAAGAVRGAASPWCTRSTTSSPSVLARSRAWRRSTGSCSTSASRRCSSTRRTAASPTRRTPRWTCGWTQPRADRGRRPQHLPVAELARILREYGEERFARRIADARSCGTARPSRSPRPARLVELLRDAIPARRGVQAGTRPSAPSRRCGSRSTTSSRCCGGRCPGDRRPRRRRPDRRHQLPLAGGPDHQAGLRCRHRSTAPPDLPVVPGARAAPAVADPRRRGGRPGGSPEPAGGVGSPARRRTRQHQPLGQPHHMNHPNKPLAPLALRSRLVGDPA